MPTPSAAGPSAGTDIGLLGAARECFEQAASEAGSVVSWRFAVDGRLVELRFAGDALVPAVQPALAHLAVHEDPRPPDLTVLLWDTASTGVPFPIDADARMVLPAWRRRQPGHEAPTSGQRVMHQPYEDMLTLLDDGVAVFWAADPQTIPFYERAAPLLHLLHWWLAGYELHLVHGAAVGTAEGGVLVVGASGSGKSTTVLSCLGSALGLASDDYSVLAVEDDPRVISLYGAVKLDADQRRRLAHVLPLVDDALPGPDGEKSVHLLRRGTTPGFPVRAVVLPRVAGDTTSSIRPVPSAATALAALAPSSILQLPGAGATALQAMRRACELVPAYELELGTDLDRVPDLLLGLLER